MSAADPNVCAANHGKGACAVCGRKDVLLYNRDGDATIRLTYHDGPDHVACKGGGQPVEPRR